MNKVFFCIIFFKINLISIACGSSTIDCDFNNYDFYAVDYKYRCQVSNNLKISSPESAQITAVNGVHMTGKTNNDEIYFFAIHKHIEYFPQGLEKFFSNLTGIAIWNSQLKEIHQEDLKPYTKLKYLSLVNNNFEVIEDGLFDYHPDIEVIVFDHCKIFHISSTVFDNLSKLTTLYLHGNKCTSKYSMNNRKDVLEVIKSVKTTCISSEFLKLDAKLKILEDDYENLNVKKFVTFKNEVESFEKVLNSSKFSKFKSLSKRIKTITNWILLKQLDDRVEEIEAYNLKFQGKINDKIDKIEKQLNDRDEKTEAHNLAFQVKIDNRIDNIEKILTEISSRSIIRNPWMILSIAIAGFTQVIILAVMYKLLVI